MTTQDNTIHKNTSQTLCWECANACGGCEWSSEFIPVPGWVAEKRRKKEHCSAAYEHFNTSYLVMECPKFKRDSMDHGLKRLVKYNGGIAG